MKLNTLFSVYAVVAVIFCLGLLLFPSFWIRLYGAHADPQAALLLRLVGALFGGLAASSPGDPSPPLRCSPSAFWWWVEPAWRPVRRPEAGAGTRGTSAGALRPERTG